MIKKLGRVETDGRIDRLWPLWIPSLTQVWHIIFDQKNYNGNDDEDDKDGSYDAKFDNDDVPENDDAETELMIFDNGETDCDDENGPAYDDDYCGGGDGGGDETDGQI